MAIYRVLTTQSFPGQKSDGSFGSIYKITFVIEGTNTRDTIDADDIDADVIDKAIKAKIAKHEAISKLGG